MLPADGTSAAAEMRGFGTSHTRQLCDEITSRLHPRGRAVFGPNRTLGDHSPLMLAALMIGHHFSISDFWSAPSACGVCRSRDGISNARLASRSCTAGLAIASNTAALILATMSCGVPFGAQNPLHTDT